MNGDFSDGVLVAEVIHHYSNNLVSVPDIQRLENNLQLGWDKRLNWLELDPVFIALNIRILEQCLKATIAFGTRAIIHDPYSANIGT